MAPDSPRPLPQSTRQAIAYPTLLRIAGADRPQQITRQGRTVNFTGSTDVAKLLDGGKPHHRLDISPDFFRQQRRPDLSPYECILNLITEPEHNSQVLENLRELLRDFPGRVVNRPEAVLRSTRDQVASQLAGITGLIVPQTVRLNAGKLGIAMQTIEQTGLQFPVIVRQAGTHTGEIVGRFDGAEDMRAAVAGGDDHIATEFIDFRSSDGLYRKFRIFFFGKHAILRHMLVSDNWNVHSRDRRRFMADRPALLDEEERLLLRPEGAFAPEVSQALKQVRERMALDFFGMDFGITGDGRAVLFEANATMNFFPFLSDPRFAYVQRCQAPAQRAFRDMLGLAAALPASSSSEADLKLAR